jgi:hypothetical protein
MQIFLIIIYCLMAVLILFGITFHDELSHERHRKHARLIVINGGRAKFRRRA